MMAAVSRRRIKRQGDATPDTLSKRSSHTRKTSGTSSIDTKEIGGGRDKKEKLKSTFFGDLCKVIVHLIFIVICIFAVVLGAEFNMLQTIEWEYPKTQQPRVMEYFGASFITKDFDCSILARRCHMSKKKLRHCFVPAFLCNSLLRPDMFPTEGRREERRLTYFVNVRHVTSNIDMLSRKTEIFNTFHDRIERLHILSRLKKWEPKFAKVLTNSKGMPRDNQLFFIPWELVDQESTYKKDFDYIDLNMDDVPDCVQPKKNTDLERRNWIQTFSVEPRNNPSKGHFANRWNRASTQRTDRFRVDTVPGFSGAFAKKILDASIAIAEHELSHSLRGTHRFKDDHLILIYRHILLHALRNPFLMLFNYDEWHHQMTPFDPDLPITFDDYGQMLRLANTSASISFLFGSNTVATRNTKLPDSLAVTISQAKSKLGNKTFDINVPIRISLGLKVVEIVSSAQGERAFHANIITALRVILRHRLEPNVDKIPDFNDLLHIPMTFYSMEERKMVFDQYSIQTDLRNKLCKQIIECATVHEQHSIDWQTRFNGTTAIQYSGKDKTIYSRIAMIQDKRNYAVGY